MSDDTLTEARLQAIEVWETNAPTQNQIYEIIILHLTKQTDRFQSTPLNGFCEIGEQDEFNLFARDVLVSLGYSQKDLSSYFNL
tara:strand:- start:335 stop:586 length:252 start_codon:yes stop_codon:yes gene_type:complete